MCIVKLEFKRIQTYLFASPRLRAMLGANASLGRVIRVDLAEAARICGAEALPEIIDHLPSEEAKDPLTMALQGSHQSVLLDAPASLYRTHGVLVRDGGHFSATFPDQDKARDFIAKAGELVTEKLPGILMDARLNGEIIQQPTSGESIFQHPGFQVSHQQANRPAETRGSKGVFVSAEENEMEEMGRTFRSSPSDLIGILEQARIIPCADEPPHDLTELTGKDDYLALIHADGNGMGKRYLSWREAYKDNKDQSLQSEAHGEHFFHSMRVAVRRALVEALTAVFKDCPKNYQILMLGGDDLLIACSASHALPFVCAYAEALKKYPLSDKAPLSIGAGVAIAKNKFPFYRLHAMAEALADSAKQRYRSNPDIGSVVDWHVTSNAWVEDPIAERRADSLTDSAILSGKPYPALGKHSLQALLAAAQNKSESPRSQLRQFVENLRQGVCMAELAWMELPKEMRQELKKDLLAFDQKGPFRKHGQQDLSILPDLIELFEIDRKGRAANGESVQ